MSEKKQEKQTYCPHLNFENPNHIYTFLIRASLLLSSS